MVSYWKSQEGLKEYQKIGVPYPTTEWDKDYDRFIEKTGGTAEGVKEKTEIKRITRVQASDEKEYIIYDENKVRYDGLDNADRRFRENIGTYPIPQGKKEVYYDENNIQKTRTTNINNVETGYSIPFTKQKLEELHKNAADKVAQRTGKTQYFVEKLNGSLISVESYEDLREADFEELFKYGKKKLSWKEEKEQRRLEKEQLDIAQEVSEVSAKEEEPDSAPPAVIEEQSKPKSSKK